MDCVNKIDTLKLWRADSIVRLPGGLLMWVKGCIGEHLYYEYLLDTTVLLCCQRPPFSRLPWGVLKMILFTGSSTYYPPHIAWEGAPACLAGKHYQPHIA